MGADIHFFVEVQPDLHGNWELAPGQTGPCDTCKGSGLNSYQAYCISCTRPVELHTKAGKCLFGPDQLKVGHPPCDTCVARGHPVGVQLIRFYQGRNYVLFGILGEVRGSGEDDFTQPNRGVPDDLCPELAREVAFSQAQKYGDFGYTYYSLTELLRRDWYAKKYDENGIADEYYDLSHFGAVVDRIYKLHHKPEQVRVVMWFDN